MTPQPKASRRGAEEARERPYAVMLWCLPCPALQVRDYLFMGDTTDGQGNITAVRFRNLKLYTKTYSQPSCTEPGEQQRGR